MKIVHVIDGLPLGGTENQLLGLLPDLAREHEVVLVTLRDDDRPGLGELPVARRYRLRFHGPKSLPRAVIELRRLIAAERPDLVRSQLYWSNIAARLATPRNIPLIFSIHSTMSLDAYTKRPSARWLDKLTYRRRHQLLGVSEHVVDDFDRYVGRKGQATVLTNYVNPLFAENRRPKSPFGWPPAMVAVGNLKKVKNYSYLLRAMADFGTDLTLDIYGEGCVRPELEREIAKLGVKARLLGVGRDMWTVLPNYDLFVMPSLHEGCPNAAIEAMAAGLPLLLSDLPVMHEVSHGNALFFDPLEPASFVDVMRRIRSGEVDLEAMAERGIQLAEERHMKPAYIRRLNAIYAQAVEAVRRTSDRHAHG